MAEIENLVAGTPQQDLGGFKKWVELSQNPPTVDVQRVLDHYEPRLRGGIAPILKKMDSMENPDGRITYWEFLSAVDPDGDGQNGTGEAALLLRGNVQPPLYCTAEESLSCYQEHMSWQAEFGLIRNLVVYLQGDQMLGDCGITLENLDLVRRGKAPESSDASAEVPERDEIWRVVDVYFDSRVLEGYVPHDFGDDDYNVDEMRGLCLTGDELACEEGLDDGYEDPDYEDRFERYGGDDDAVEDDGFEGEEIEYADEEGGWPGEKEEPHETAVYETVSDHEWQSWSEEFPDLTSDLENKLLALSDIEADREEGGDYNKEIYEDLLEDSNRMITHMRRMILPGGFAW